MPNTFLSRAACGLLFIQAFLTSFASAHPTVPRCFQNYPSSPHNISVPAIQKELGHLLSKGSVIFGPSDPRWHNTTDGFQELSPPDVEIVVQPGKESDISKIVKYCNEKSIKYLALNRKHGWSSTLGGFKGMQIDMTSLSSLTIQPDNKSAIIQGGAYLGEVIDTLWDAGYVAVTGSSACPGFVGPALGGGHGRYEGLYGLASDNVIRLNMVLADGSKIQVSKSSHSDLFWGMKGAGQNFGIVTSAEAKIYPREIDTWHYHNYIWTQDKLETLFETLNIYHGNGTTPARMGVNHGIYMIDPSISKTEAVLSWTFAYAGPAEEAEKILQPFNDIEAVSHVSGDVSYPELVEIQGTGLSSPVCYHGDHPVSSALLRTWNITTQRQIYDMFNEKVALYPELANTAILLETYATKGMSDIPAHTSAYPWREELHIVLFFASLEPGSDLLEPTQQWAQETRDLWHAGEPTLPPRTYMNYGAGIETPEEMYGYEPWRLEKLRGLKSKYDPHNQFRYYNSFVKN
ncbi:putative FAD binding domain-containing protein [Rosellinia necatrix]|uniref:Putative FAD binding domain-containing protein n=1 Tax=Rosellinia necatrix TaxID=77044 RepID=A0A1W2TJ59_ROSNE|nr:putative FAD binding domain-containing protein [Rosellinia necatrix]